MYAKHFRLHGMPFEFTPSPAAFFAGASHREALAALEWGLLHEPSGFTLLVGRTGMGKSTLIAALLERHRNHLRIVHLSNPQIGAGQMLPFIAQQLGIKTAGGASRRELLDALQKFLGALKPGERVAVLIDEAQALSEESLEELRLLSNCGRVEEQQLCFILVGQPELLRRLAEEPMRSLNERIGARAILTPLGDAEARDYVAYRLAVQGGRVEAIFARRALRHLITQSLGVPRLINVLCHNAMLFAYSRDAKRITLGMARRSVREREESFVAAAAAGRAPAGRAAAKVMRPAAALAALCLAGGLVVYGWPPARQPAGAVVGDAPQARPAHAIGYLEPPAVATETSVAVAPAATQAQTIVPGADDPRRDNFPVALTERLEEPRLATTSNAAAKPGDAGVPHETGAFHGTASDIQPAEATANRRQDSTRRVRVVAGDTLGKIAQHYLGSEDELPRLVSANPQFPDINLIYPGDIVVLPLGAGSARSQGSSWANTTKR